MDTPRRAAASVGGRSDHQIGIPGHVLQALRRIAVRRDRLRPILPELPDAHTFIALRELAANFLEENAAARLAVPEQADGLAGQVSATSGRLENGLLRLPLGAHQRP